MKIKPLCDMSDKTHMNEIIFPRPDDEALWAFIQENNRFAGEAVGMSDVFETFQRKAMHPGVVGHFAAFEFMFKNLVMQQNWPAKHPIEYDTLASSDKNLEWLRSLHKQLTASIARHGPLTRDWHGNISMADCGRYRIRDAEIGLGRKMPKPAAISRLLQWWHKDLGDFHLKWAPRLRRLSIPDVELIHKFARAKHIQLCCIHPFQDGNGRIARLLENALRLRWGMSWKLKVAKTNQDYINEIMKFEDSKEWHDILAGA